jgi:hypothetical protein
MFDEGRQYTFVMIEGTSDGWGEVTFSEVVSEIDGPLLRLADGRVINSHSSLFVSATPEPALLSESAFEDA